VTAATIARKYQLLAHSHFRVEQLRGCDSHSIGLIIATALGHIVFVGMTMITAAEAGGGGTAGIGAIGTMTNFGQAEIMMIAMGTGTASPINSLNF
jgi:hypothetical protein